MKEPENYTSYVIVGLALTVLLVAGLAFYSFNEARRLERTQAAFTEERVLRGDKIYTQQCVACHGAQGEGGVGPALKNRTLLKNTFDSAFFSIIRSGVPNTKMPAWGVEYGGPLTDEDVRDVVALMRSWEDTAPEVKPVVFTPDPARGALLFASTCAVCHGENGLGGKNAPKLNDLQRLQSLSDDWYRATIRNGRPAKGMPTWGTVLSPNQVDDLVAMIAAWRLGQPVQAEFSTKDLIDSAIFSLQNNDAASATLHIGRALQVARGKEMGVLRNIQTQLLAGDNAAALAALQAARDAAASGDPTAGAAVYTANCGACHGPQGGGGIGKALNPSEFVAAQSNADLAKFILAGRPGTAMAGFEGRLTEAQLADVIAFLRLWNP